MEIQRNCNKLYSNLKHRVLVLLNKRLYFRGGKRGARGLFRLKDSDDYYAYNSQNKFSKQSQQQQQQHAQQSSSFGGSVGNLFDELNDQFLMNSPRNAISIPMQMLLFPFVVQSQANDNQMIGSLDQCSSLESDRSESAPSSSYGASRGGLSVGAQNHRHNHHPYHTVTLALPTITVQPHSQASIVKQQQSTMFAHATASEHHRQSQSRIQFNSATRDHFNRAAGQCHPAWPSDGSTNSFGSRLTMANKLQNTITNRGLTMRNPLMGYQI